MTAHAHLALVQAIRAVVTGLPLTGTRVFDNTEVALGWGELPALAVFPAREVDVPDFRMDLTEWHIDRKMTVVVGISARTEAERADIMFDVEQAIAASPQGIQTRLVQIVFPVAREESDRTIYAAEYHFMLQYGTSNLNPGVNV